MAKAIERASTDATFRAQLQSNPESALAGYDLTGDERAALLSGDSSQLGSMGVDARVTRNDNFGGTDRTSNEGQGVGGFGS